jgi:Tfp pilus assembly protein FimV
MAVPWLQIVQLVPSILDVSRELLKRSKRPPPQAEAAPENPADLTSRVASLEENERRQAELVSQMAEQLAALARAVTALHQRVMWLAAIAIAALVLAAVATTWG